MHDRVRTLRRRRLATAAVLLGVALVPLGAVVPAQATDEPCAAGTPGVTVQFKGQDSDGTAILARTVCVPIAGNTDIDHPVYYVRAAKGDLRAPLATQPDAALSIHALVAKAVAKFDDPAVTADKVTFSETAAADKIPLVLSPAELGAPDPDAPIFDDGLQPAVYATADQGVGYIRPLRTAPDDVNAAESFQTTAGTPLTITLRTTGRLLTPTVKVADTTVDTTATSAFSVDVTPDPGSALDYAWDFADGTADPAVASPSHRYTKTGTYAVVVAVRARDGSFGRSAPVTMTIGKPKPVKTPKTPKPGSGSGSGSGSGPVTPPYQGYVPGPAGDPFDDPLGQSPDPSDPGLPVEVPDGLVPVEGYVLAGAQTGTTETIPGTTTPPPATRDSDPLTGRRIVGWVIGGLALLLLVGLGAAAETPWVRKRLPLLRRAA